MFFFLCGKNKNTINYIAKLFVINVLENEKLCCIKNIN